jgi:TRAP-type C4-dicarboxylate transport system substrate-binding protein
MERRHFLKLAYLSFTMLITSVILAHGQPTSTPTPQKQFTLLWQSPWSSRITYASDFVLLDAIERNTNGRIKFKRHINAELVPTKNALEACGRGTLDGTMGPGTYYSGVVPEGDFDLLPFNIKSLAQGAFFLKLPEVRKVYRDAYAPLNLYSLGAVAHYADIIMTKKPIRNVSDFKGIKIRTGGGLLGRCMEALGTAPVMIPVGDIYAALQRGTVDGCIMPSSYMIDAGYVEVVKYISNPPLVPVEIEQYWVNMDTWKKLGPELQQIVQDTFDAHSFFYALYSIRVDEMVERECMAKGVQYITLPASEATKMEEMMMPVIKEWGKKKPGCARLLELREAWSKVSSKDWTLK